MDGATLDTTELETEQYDKAIAELQNARHAWARTTPAERIAILHAIKDATLGVSDRWAESAAHAKGLPDGSPLVGEEWFSGPYALMTACNGLITTLTGMDGKTFVDDLPKRTGPNDQLIVRVMPHNFWDRLLLSGVTADVWMQPGVTCENLKANTAGGYDRPSAERDGKVSLVLGAGNIAAIAPLDCFQKLFVENEVVLLKMNPVNDYLTESLEIALKPLIDRDALRIVKGGGAAGEYLCTHDGVETIHITGAGATHDAIVWGVGDDGARNKAAGTPRNPRPITSELGAVCPTIVVPGPWSAADVAFQAENIATQKMHNSGFNCVACQTLILPDGWLHTDPLMAKLAQRLAEVDRPLYYPGAADRMAAFRAGDEGAIDISRGGLPSIPVASITAGSDAQYLNNEVFAPALSTKRIAEDDPEAYLRQAIAWSNENLHGTLGGNILIHPKTIRDIGKTRFEEILAEFRYGCIAVNGWTGIGFLLAQTPWGAFPGHTLDDVQSGIGFVHNTFMFDRPERTVVTAPFRPFPRNLLTGAFTMLPRPPWFVTNKTQAKIGKRLTRFQHRPSWRELPGIFWNALTG